MDDVYGLFAIIVLRTFDEEPQSLGQQDQGGKHDEPVKAIKVGEILNVEMAVFVDPIFASRNSDNRQTRPPGSLDQQAKWR